MLDELATFRKVTRTATLLFGALAGCAGQSDLGSSAHAFTACFVTPPENSGDRVLLPDTKGWRLVLSRPVDPAKHPENPYVGAGCYDARNCKEFWFQKNTGEIRYCVTNDCWVGSVDFQFEGDMWRLPESRQFVCTS